MPTYPTGLASSQDNTQLSLTVSSFTQMILFFVAAYAAHAGMNPTTATTEVQAIIDLLVTTFPLVMALYHAVMTFWGLARKLFALFKKAPTVSTVTVQ